MVEYPIDPEVATVKGDLCKKARRTWSENYGNTRHCDDQCKVWEGATYGACHTYNNKHIWFYYFNCPKAEKLAQPNVKAKKLSREKIEVEKVLHLEHPIGPIYHP
ncbi:hypothetical protein OSB04_006223 [Centaurea solstitialis]|uniref:Defensin n=1 Tax=Centaurea solstitialis TaxID=347529 RepID=A0AA38TQ35_9ASTR|nr:hypothetical protein OSB04_006223 [Centaurea solstitialis]